MQVKSIESNEDERARGLSLKIIGVGGAGIGFVRALIASGLTGVEYIVADAGLAEATLDEGVIHLPLGDVDTVGVSPEAARAAAMQSREAIENLVAGAHMVIVVAGLGGGAGSGAAAAIAEIARASGALTAAFVTRPGGDEDKHRVQRADAAILALTEAADSLFVVDRDAFDRPIGAGGAPALTAHALTVSVSALTGFLLRVGLVCFDFEDVRELMGRTGQGAVATAAATGEGRGRLAVERALASGPLSSGQLRGAQGVVFAILAPDEGPERLRMRDVREAMDSARDHWGEDTSCIFGTAYADLGEEVRVVLLACGVESRVDPSPAACR